MNVVYMGTPVFALPALQALASSNHSVCAVVTGPDKHSGRGRRLTPSPVKSAARELNLPVLTPSSLKDEDFIEQLAEYRADLFAVIAFRILPPAVFSLPKNGSINIHGSLLPKYRGAAPIQRALMNGETKTGLSAFFIEQTVDTGAVIAQVTESIKDDDNYTTLSGRLSELSAKFLIETIDRIESGEVSALAQDDTQATGAPKITDSDLQIDWSRPADQIINQIRALADTPGAYTHHSSGRLKILGAKASVESISAPRPGEIMIDNKKIYIGAGENTAILAIRLQPEGKTTRTASEIINGGLLKSGDKLNSNLGDES